MNDELITLQELAAHQSVEIAHLSDELHKQQQEIQMLKEQIRRLLNKMSEQEEASRQSHSQAGYEPPPPHY